MSNMKIYSFVTFLRDTVSLKLHKMFTYFQPFGDSKCFRNIVFGITYPRLYDTLR